MRRMDYLLGSLLPRMLSPCLLLVEMSGMRVNSHKMWQSRGASSVANLRLVPTWNTVRECILEVQT